MHDDVIVTVCDIDYPCILVELVHEYLRSIKLLNKTN